MGSRASYVIIKEGSKKYFYHHWGAQSIPEDLFWGSGPSVHFVQSLPETDGLLDNVWCEGTAVLDCDNQKLLLFGGEDILWSNSLKRIYLALLKISWKGWDVKWARSEVYSIAKAIGDNPTRLVDEVELPSKFTKNDLKQSMEYNGALVSIKKAGSIRHYEMDYRSDALLSQGEEIIPLLDDFKGTSLSQKKPGFGYESYLFLNQDNLEIFYDNEFSRHHNLHKKLSSIWLNWQVFEHNQGMYRHTMLCGLDWREWVSSRDSLLKCLSDILLRGSGFNPQDTINAIIESGRDVEVIAPLFLQKDSPNVTPETKEAILKNTLKQWLSATDHFEAALSNEIW